MKNALALHLHVCGIKFWFRPSSRNWQSERERLHNSFMCQSLSRLGCFIGFFWTPSMLEKDFMCPYTTNICTIEYLAILLTIIINIKATSQRSTSLTLYLTSSSKTIKWLHWLKELIIGLVGLVLIACDLLSLMNDQFEVLKCLEYAVHNYFCS